VKHPDPAPGRLALEVAGRGHSVETCEGWEGAGGSGG